MLYKNVKYILIKNLVLSDIGIPNIIAISSPSQDRNDCQVLSLSQLSRNQLKALLEQDGVAYRATTSTTSGLCSHASGQSR